MLFSKTDIEAFDKVFRLNLINGIGGFKAGNLIGTKSKTGVENLAVFSSVVHIGSHPPLLGMVLRPLTVPRDSHQNIIDSGVYTINHIHHSFTQKAHYTSAKFPNSVSEFNACGLESEYLGDFKAPFVKESRIKLGMRLVEELPIKSNNTLMLIGEIELIALEDGLLTANGRPNLEAAGSVAISGLNQYYSAQLKNEYPYARVEELPEF